MQQHDALAYYRELAGRYLEEVRRFVPKYDEMVRYAVGLLKMNSPHNLLDIGSGVGNVEEVIFRQLPRSRITCVEPVPEMVHSSRSRLRRYRGRIAIMPQEILDFAPNQVFDTVFSNLTLHNLRYRDKEELTGRIRNWLKPKGTFVWGDLIRYEDEGIQKHFVDYRRRFALKRRASRKFTRDTFRKERQYDYPLTIEETLDLTRNVGFRKPENTWTHDTFAIFYMKK